MFSPFIKLNPELVSICTLYGPAVCKSSHISFHLLSTVKSADQLIQTKESNSKNDKQIRNIILTRPFGNVR